MNNTNTLKEKIAVMQAYADGHLIEFKPVSGNLDWDKVSIPSWNWDSNHYRVKREPKVIYVTRYADGGLTSFNTASAEKRNADLCRTHRPGSVVASERYIQDLNYKPEQQ